MLTAYDFFTARTLDEAGVDVLLVGDTVGMALGGMETTLGVRLEHILYHSEMVGRGTRRAMIVGDMPFLTYQVTVNQAVENAGRLMQEGKVHAVKLEGGRAMVPAIKRILTAGIPVMGHLGLTPQSVHRFGGWQVQGKDEESADRVKSAALALEDAGCFALVLEAVPSKLAREVFLVDAFCSARTESFPRPVLSCRETGCLSTNSIVPNGSMPAIRGDTEFHHRQTYTNAWRVPMRSEVRQTRRPFGL